MNTLFLKTKKILTVFLLLETIISPVASLLIFPNTAKADFNPQINYQGKLTNSSNVAVADGTYHMRFYIYNTTGGATTSALWTEDRSTAAGNRVTVTNGLFSVMLGSSSPLTNLDFNQTLYLGIEIGGSSGSPVWDGEMSPRKILGAVPAAFVAQSLDGATSTQFVRTDTSSTISTSSADTALTINQRGTGNVFELQFGGVSFFTASSTNIGIGTTSPYEKLSVAGNIISDSIFATSTLVDSIINRFTFQNASGTNATTTNATTTNLFSTTGTFIDLFASTLNLTNLLVNGSTTLQNFTFQNATGSQATTTNFFSTNGTFTNLFANTANLTESGNLFYLDSRVNTYINASTTIPKTYTANTFTSAQIFDLITRSTTTQATTTNLAVTSLSSQIPYASPNGAFTPLTIGTNLVLTNGTLNASASFAWPFTKLASNEQATGTTLAFLNGFLAPASSTLSTFTFTNATGSQATTTNLAISSITSGLVKALSGGSLVAATAGTDYQSPVSATFPVLFNSNVISLGFGTTTNNSWSGAQTFLSSTTLQAFTGTNYLALGSTTLQNFTGTNYLALGSTTLQAFTASNATTTNATTTNLFSTNGTFTNLFASTLNLTNLLVNGSTTIQNFTFQNATGTNATTTNLYVSGLASTTQIRANTANISSLTSRNLLVNGSTTLQNFTFQNATGTSATTTNLYVSGLASTTNLRANTGLFGNVGIGTTSPVSRFAITSDGTGYTKSVVIADSNNVEKLSFLSNGRIQGDSSLPYLELSTGNGTSLGYSGAVLGINASQFDFNKKVYINNAELILNNSGFSMVGFSDWTTDLGAIPLTGNHVMGSGPINSTNFMSKMTWTNLQNNSTAASFRTMDTFAPTNTSTKFIGLYISPIINQTGTASGDIIGIDYNPTLTSLQGNNYAALFRTGNVGIGLTNPAYKLEVNGISSTTELFVTSATTTNSYITNLLVTGSTTFQGLYAVNATTTNATTTNLAISSNLHTSLTSGSIPFISGNGLLTQNNSQLFWNSTNSSLGLGTTTPGGKLAIYTSTAPGTGGEPSLVGALRIIDQNGDTNQTGGIEFKSSISGAGYGWRISNPDIGGNYNNLFFQSRTNSASWTNALAFQGSTGRVGIGTTSPNNKLDIFSTNTDSAQGFISSSTAGAYMAWTIGTDISDSGKFKISSSTALGTNDRFVIDGNGNVGIGSTTPSQLFSLGGNAYITGGVGIGKVNSAAGTLETSGIAGIGSNLYLRALLNCNTAASSLQTDASGQVSCGTITAIGGTSAGGWTWVAPDRVQLATTSDVVVVGTGSSSPYAKFFISSGSTATTTFGLAAVSSQTSNILDVYDNSTNLTSVITASGLWGLGTATPLSRLAVSGGASIGANYNIAAPTNGLIVEGNVGIGTTSPETKLDVSGTIRGVNLWVNGSTTLQAFTGINYLALSSTTLQNFTFQNSTGTNATTTNLFSTNGTFTNLFASTLNFADLLVNGSTTLQNLTFQNATGTSATTTNLFSTNGTFTNLFASTLNITDLLVNGSTTLQNFTFQNATGTNATTTNLYVSGLASTTQIRTNTADIGSLTTRNLLVNGSTTLQNFTFQNATGTNATTTNLYVSGLASTTDIHSNIGDIGSLITRNLLVNGSTTLQSFTATQGTITSATSTNSYITNLLVNGSTTLQSFTATQGTITSATSTNSYITNLLVNGSTTLQNFTGIDYLALGSTTLQDFTSTNATTTNATTTNLFSTNGTFTNLFASTLNITDLLVNGSTTLQNFTASNGTTTQATTTNLAVTSLSSQIPYASPNGALVPLTIGANLTLINGTLSSAPGFTFPFTTQTDWGTHNATSTLLGFKAGFYSLASSTIGNNTNSGGLTIFGGATTTGQFLALGSTTLQSFTATQGTITSATSTNLYTTNFLALGSTTLQALRATSATATNLYSTNFLALGSTTLQAFTGTNYLALGSTTLQNFTFQNATGTNATTTNLYVSGRASTTELRANTAYFGGNVGIGTTSPTQNLQINLSNGIAPATSGNAQGMFGISGWGGTTVSMMMGVAGAALGYPNGLSWIQSQRLENSGTSFPLGLNPNGGNVGIGTSSPLTTLSVAGNTYLGGNVTATGTATVYGSLMVLSSSTLQAFTGTNYLALGSTTLQNFTFQNATGTSATTTNLHVSGLASTTQIRANIGYIGNLFTTQSTFTNLLVNGSTTLQNLTFQNATGTNATTTNLYVSGLASTTDIHSNIGDIGSLITRNLLVNGSTTLQNFTFQNATGTSATTTNLYTSGQTILAGTSGNVGIGVDPAGYKLRVGGNISASSGGLLDFGSGNSRIVDGSTNYYMAFQTWTGSALTEKMRITSAGNIGIGTTTPAYKLSVEGTSTLGNEAIAGFFTATSTTATSTFAAPVQTTKLSVTDANATSTFAGGIALTGGCITVATTTCLGMPGTVSTRWSDLVYPTAPLSLAMSTHATTFNWTTGTAANDLFRLTTDGSANGTGNILFVQTGPGSTVKPLRVLAGSTEALAVDISGNVGIGTTTPGGKLAINSASGPGIGAEPDYKGTVRILDSLGNVSENGGIEFKSSITGAGYGWRITNPDIGGNYNNLFFQSRSNSASWTNAITFQGSTGNSSFGSTSPYAKLSVWGSDTSATTKGFEVVNNASTTGFAIFNDGSMFVNGSTTLQAFTGTNYLALGSTTLQNFTFQNATGTNATTTNLYVSGLASTTNLRANTGLFGNVGIGTTNPGAILDIAVTGNGTEVIRLSTERSWSFLQSGTGASSRLRLKDNTGSKIFEIVGSDDTTTAYFYNETGTPANSRVLLLPSGGNVGIGTTTALTKLSVAGSAYIGGWLVATGTAQIDGATVLNSTLFVNSSSTLQNFTFQNATGTSATTTNLHVSGLASTTQIRANIGYIGNLFTTQSTFTNLLVNGSTTLQNFTFQNATGTNATTTNLYVSGLASTTNLRANTGLFGNVGIGLSNPTTKLHISDITANAPQILVENTSTYGIRLGLNSSNIGFMGSANATPIQIQTNGIARMYFDTTGNVGIGTTTPAGAQLVISSSTGPQLSLTDASLTSNIWTFRNLGNNLYISTSSPTSFSTSTNPAVSIDGILGNVKIGTTSEAYTSSYTATSTKLQVGGAGKFGFGSYGTSNQTTVTDASLIIPTGGQIYMENAQGHLRTLIKSDGNGNVDIGQSGTAIVPSISLKAGNAGYISMVPGGGEAMRIVSSGLIGIGTTSPIANVDIFKASADASQGFTSSSTAGVQMAWTIGTDISDSGKFKISSSTLLGLNDRFVIDGNGLVSMTNLLVSGSTTLQAFTGTNYLALGSTTLQNFTFQNATGTSATTTNLYTSGQTVLAGTSGNVGIGTANLTYLFESNRAGDGTNTVQLSGSGSGTGNTVRVYRNRSAANTDAPLVDFINDAATDDQVLLRLQQDASADIINVFDGITEVFTILDGGNVGIGLTNPAYKLEVSGVSSTTGLFATSATSTNSYITNLLISGSTTLQNFTASNATTTNLAVSANLHTSLTSGSVPFIGGNGLLTQNNSQLFWNNTATGLGIGTTTPGGKLAIYTSTAPGTGGEPSLVGALRIIDQNGDTNQTGGIEFKSSISGAGYGWRISNPDIGGNYNNLFFQSRTNSASWTNAIAFQGSTGRVGIGTTSPNNKLDIFSTNADSAQGFISSSTAGAYMAWTIGTDISDGGKFKISSSTALGTNDRFVIDGNGNVGIGTSTPYSALGISRNLGNGTLNILQSISGETMSTAVSGSAIVTRYGVNASDFGGIGGYSNGSAGIGIWSSTVAGAPELYVNSSGSLGVGTTTPTRQLTVAGVGTGILRVDGSFSGAPARRAIVELSSDDTGRAQGVITISAGTEGWFYGKPYSADAFTIGYGSAQAEYPAQSKLYITSAGNVGIGSSTPSQKFSVSGSAFFDGGTIYTSSLVATSSITTPSLTTTNLTYTNELVTNSTTTNATTTYLFVSGRASTTELRANTALFGGNVGIGTTTPNTLLSLVGNGPVLSLGSSGINDPRVDFYDQSTTAVGASIFLDQDQDTLRILRTASGGASDGIAINSSGYVGIGTTTPTALLSVQGATANQFMLSYDNTNSTRIFTNSGGALVLDPSDAGETLYLGAAGTYYMKGGASASNLYALTLNRSGGVATVADIWSGGNNLVIGGTSAGAGTVTINTSGGAIPNAYFTGSSVGIGTTTPTATLEVRNTSGPVLRLDSTAVGGASMNLRQSGITRGGLAVSGAWEGDSTSDMIMFAETGGQLRFYTNGSATEVMTIQTDGDVGLGATTPQYQLSLGSTGDQIGYYSDATHYSNIMLYNGSTGAMVFDNVNGGTSEAYQFNYNTGNIVTFLKNGNVGIGTSTPLAKLSVYDGDESATLTTITQSLTNAGLNIISDYTASAYVPGILWSTRDNNPTIPKAGIWLLEDGTGTDMYFGTSNSYGTGITNNGLVLDQSGNVGIGTTTPSRSLTVSSSGAPQISLTDASLTNNAWTFRSLGNYLYVATSSPTSFSTSTVYALGITPSGVVTIPYLATTTDLHANVADIGNLRAGLLTLTNLLVTGSSTLQAFTGTNYLALGSTTLQTFTATQATINATSTISNLTNSQEYSITLPITSEEWIKLATIPNPSYATFVGNINSSNSEETFKIDIGTTYYTSQALIDVDRQTYNERLREVRVEGADGGTRTVYIKIRTSAFAPTVTWRVLNAKGTITVVNATSTTPTGAVFATLPVTVNTSNNTTKTPLFFKASNDAYTTFTSSSTAGVSLAWSLGTDISDSGKFKISSSTALGTSDRFVIDGSGYVGIGTSSPTRSLTVDSSSGPIISLVRSTVNMNRFEIETDGTNMSIGPRDSGSLILKGGAFAEMARITSTGLQVTGSTTLQVVGATYASTTQIQSTGQAYFATAGGNVGIGTVAPAYKLEVVGTLGHDNIQISKETSINSGTYGVTYKTLMLGEEGSRSISLNYDPSTNTSTNFNGTDQIFIQDSKGILAPNTADTAFIGVLRPMNDRVYFGGSLSSGDLSGNGMTILTSSGNVGVGTISPNYKFEVSGTASTTNLYATNATNTALYVSGLASTTDIRSNTANIGNLVVTSCTGCSTGGTPLPWAFTKLSTGEQATSTTLAFLNGFISTASSTINSNLAITGTLGVGVTSPTFGKLQVTQSSNISTGGIASINSGGTTGAFLWADTGTIAHLDAGSGGTDTLSLNAGGGNVGIGTSSPSRMLTVSKSSAPQLALTDASLTSNAWTMRSLGNFFYLATSSPTSLATSTVPSFTITPSNMVGIGTSTPAAATLSVQGSIYASGNILTSGNLLGSLPFNYLTTPLTAPSINMSTYSTVLNWTTGTASNDLFRLTTDASANGTGSLLFVQSGSGSTVKPLRVLAGTEEAIYVDTSGRTGFGTTSPGARLDVNQISGQPGAFFGDIAGTGTGGTMRFISAQGPNSTADYYIQLFNNSRSSTGGVFRFTGRNGANDTLDIDVTNSRVGIGSTTPGTTLSVVGTTTGYGFVPSANLAYGLGSAGQRFKDVWVGTANIGTSTWSISNGSDGRLTFNNAANSAGTETVSLATNGNVGIGVTNPQFTLEVAGNQKFYGVPTASSSFSVSALSSSLAEGTAVSGGNGLLLKLDSERFVVVASNAASVYLGKYNSTDVSIFPAITFDSSFYANGQPYISITALDSNRFVIGYAYSSWGTKAVVCTASNETITCGTPTTITTNANPPHVSVDVIDSTYFIMGITDPITATGPVAKVVQTSGNTIVAVGSAGTIADAVTTNYASIKMLAGTTTRFAYQYYAGGIEKMAIGNISGTSTISFGAPANMSVSAARMPILALSSSTVVTFSGTGANVILANITSTSTIATSSVGVLTTTSNNSVYASFLNGSDVVVSYSGVTNAFRILSFSSTTLTSIGAEQFAIGTSITNVAGLSSNSFLKSSSQYVSLITGRNTNTTYSTLAMNSTYAGSLFAYNVEPVGISLGDGNLVYLAANSTLYMKAVLRTGNGMAVGTQVNVATATISWVSAAPLDSTKFVTTYSKSSGGGLYQVDAMVCSAVALTITCGNPVAIATGFTSNVYSSVDALDSSNFVVAYASSSVATSAFVKVGTVSGTSISSLGSAQSIAFSSANPSGIKVTTINGATTKFAFAISGSNFAKTVVGNTSGTTITLGTAGDFATGTPSYMNIISMGSDSYQVIFSNASYGIISSKVSITGSNTISTTTQIIGGAGSSGNGNLKVDILDSTHYIVLYGIANPAYGRYRVVQTSGDTISLVASEQKLDQTSITNIQQFRGAVGLDSTSFAVEYYTFDGVSSYQSYSAVVNLDDNDLYYQKKALVINSTGLSVSGNPRVGVGISSPSYTLHVLAPSTDTIVAMFGIENGSYCSIQPANTALVCSSDARMKENINTIASSTEIIRKLRGVNFNWIGDSAKANRIGFIAQEVQVIAPELVSVGPDGMLGVNYLNFAPYLVNAWNALDVRVSSLESIATSTLPATSTPMLAVTSTGLGIGTLEPAFALHAKFGKEGTAVFENENGICEINPNTGSFGCAPSSGVVVATSTIGTNSASSTEILRKLRGVNLTLMHASTTINQFGFLADDVELIAPELVSYVGGVKLVRTTDMIPLLVNSVNDLAIKVETLEERVAKLENVASSTSATTTSATSTNLFDVQSVVSAVISSFHDMGTTIGNQMARFTSIFADQIVIGSTEKPAGITLYDVATRQPYCMRIQNGGQITTPGACSDVLFVSTTPTDGGTTESTATSTTTPTTADSGTTDPTATSTSTPTASTAPEPTATAAPEPTADAGTTEPTASTAPEPTADSGTTSTSADAGTATPTS